MRARRFLGLGFALAALSAAGCGDKIAVPEATGIPLNTDYVEQIPWTLTDPIDVIGAAGRVYVLEQSTGTITKYSTAQGELAQEEGLLNPTAMTVEESTVRLLVTEDDGVAPGISIFDLASLEPVGRADLTGLVKSLAGVASDGEFLYASDPDSGAVHRFAWINAQTELEPRGLVSARFTEAGTPASAESPNFVFEPRGLALDPEGMLLVADADTTRNWVVRFDPHAPEGEPEGRGQAVVFRTVPCATPPPSGFVLGDAPGCEEPFVGGPSEEPGGFSSPQAVAFDDDGRIYVADRGNGRVQRFEPTGTFDLLFGQTVEGLEGLGSPTRVATLAGVASRGGVTVTFSGAKVFVVDRSLAQIRLFEDTRLTEFQDDA